jgi:uncharacterized protein YhaN
MRQGPERPIPDQIQMIEDAYKDQIRQLEYENQEKVENNRRLEQEKQALEKNTQKIHKLEKVNAEQAKMICELEKEMAQLEQKRADLEAILVSLEGLPSSNSQVAASPKRRSAEDPSGIWDP